MESIDLADAYALLTDGRCVHVRSVTPEDWQAVYDFAATLGERSLYLRFFNVPGHPGETLANALCRPAVPRFPVASGALIALLEGRAVGLAEWYRTRQADEAEIAFEVADGLHGHGVATLLAEHLMLAARRAGIRRLTAITMAENREMLGVFRSLGVAVERTWEDGACVLMIPLDHASLYAPAALEAVARREAEADEASLHALFDPRSIAVLGEVGDPTTRAVLDHLAAFDGPIHDAGARGEKLPSAGPVDLAVITSPPADAIEAAYRCADSQVRTLVVTATGFTAEQGRELLNVCHTRGMRLVGPGSLGVAALSGRRGFTALVSATPVDAGHAGIAVQSGGVGLALLAHLRRLDIGVASFAGVGAKYDVSANDLLVHWERDRNIRFGLLHVESFGNPRKFARTARRLARGIPLFAVDPEQAPGQARTALYAQAGIIALPSLGELVGAAALVAHQPSPRGRRVAVVANTHGMAVLAAQACAKAGLEVTDVRDLTPAAAAGDFSAAVPRMLGERPDQPGADAIVIALAPAVACTIDPTAVSRAAGGNAPVLAVIADQAESVAVLRAKPDENSEIRIPSYNDAAGAARALAALVRAAQVADSPQEEGGVPDGVDLRALEDLVRGWAASGPATRTLEPAQCADLLTAMGLVPGAPLTGGRAVVLSGWQDPVFGPLVSVVGERGGEPRTLLVPLGPCESTVLADQMAGPANYALTDAALRLSAALDACPELASVHLRLECRAQGTALVSATAEVGPAVEDNPHLRRLRRAPVE